EGLDLRREPDATLRCTIEHRPDSDSIACQDETSRSRVPERDGELAVQSADEVEPVLLIEMDDHLGVRPRRKPVTRFFQLAPQLDEVEDLAVQHDVDGSVFVADRLVAGRKV